MGLRDGWSGLKRPPATGQLPGPTARGTSSGREAVVSWTPPVSHLETWATTARPDLLRVEMGARSRASGFVETVVENEEDEMQDGMMLL